ncbi:MAG: hypothetical protein K8V75_00980, partial [Methanobrevibacter woesei]|nr:hypothetical protein [Methanobrevibacter woesei]
IKSIISYIAICMCIIIITISTITPRVIYFIIIRFYRFWRRINLCCNGCIVNGRSIINFFTVIINS